MLTKKCIVCGKEFAKKSFYSKTTWKQCKYCSKICFNKSKIGKPAWNKGLPRTWKSNGDFQKGHTTWNEGTKGVMKPNKTSFKKGNTPWHAGTIGIKKGYNWTEEEKEKIRIRNSGSASHFWKGGISKLNYHIRRIAKYVQWRTECFIRDNYTCQECGKKGGRLQVHHKKSFELILKENKITTIEQAINCPELWDTDNGITLCIPCHTQTDTYAKNLK